MSELRQQLDQAVRQASTIIIRYNGGSRPGEERAVIPVSLSDEELVAREVGQHQAKQFKLEKIASFRPVNGETTVNPTAIRVTVSTTPEYETFEEYIALFESIAAEGRWHVVKGDKSFGVCEFFKNGKPKSTTCLLIQYMDRSSETALDVFTGEFVEEKRELTGRERPWRVESRRFKQAKPFALLSRAAELFLEELHAANQAQQ